MNDGKTQPSGDQHTFPRGRSLRAHIQIARFDHWIKNVFVLPGIIVGLSLQPNGHTIGFLMVRVILGFIATGLVASSNYVLNEILDAPFDRLHPTKRSRPVPTGLVNIPLAYVEWLLLMIAGLVVVGIGYAIMAAEQEVDGFLSLYVSPILLMVGYLEIIYAIVWRQRDDTTDPK